MITQEINNIKNKTGVNKLILTPSRKVRIIKRVRWYAIVDAANFVIKQLTSESKATLFCEQRGYKVVGYGKMNANGTIKMINRSYLMR